MHSGLFQSKIYCLCRECAHLSLGRGTASKVRSLSCRLLIFSSWRRLGSCPASCLYEESFFVSLLTHRSHNDLRFFFVHGSRLYPVWQCNTFNLVKSALISEFALKVRWSNCSRPHLNLHSFSAIQAFKCQYCLRASISTLNQLRSNSSRRVVSAWANQVC